MGCAPTRSKVGPKGADSSSVTAHSEKLPREVLEGFNKVLKTISTNPGSSRNSQLVKAAAPRNSTIANVKLPDHIKLGSAEDKLGPTREIPVLPERDQDNKTASTRLMENSNDPLVNKEISRKKLMILRPIEHKITIKSRLRTDDVKDQEVNSEKGSVENSRIKGEREDEKDRGTGTEKRNARWDHEDVDGKAKQDEEILKKPVTNKFTLKEYDELHEHPPNFIEVEEEIKFTERSEQN